MSLNVLLSIENSLCCWVFVCLAFTESQKTGDMRAEPGWLAFSIPGQRTRQTGSSVNILLGKLRKLASGVFPGARQLPFP